jgi:hypothetical protein
LVQRERQQKSLSGPGFPWAIARLAQKKPNIKDKTFLEMPDIGFLPLDNLLITVSQSAHVPPG